MVDMPTHGNKLDKVPLDGVVNIMNCVCVLVCDMRLTFVIIGCYFYLGESQRSQRRSQFPCLFLPTSSRN